MAVDRLPEDISALNALREEAGLDKRPFEIIANVGPNLDQAKPDRALVLDRVHNGQGAMPSFADSLSEQEMADVAQYVVDSTS